jgi:hypothetical protein
MSARQLTSRPKEILPLEHQSHITDVDPRARNRSGRYGPMYLVEPRGTGICGTPRVRSGSVST